MDNSIQIFENPDFGEVRTLEEDGTVLFCGSDVAKALGYARPNDAVTQHCRATVKRRTSAVQKRTLDFSNALLYNQYRSKSDTKSDLPSVKNDY